MIASDWNKMDYFYAPYRKDFIKECENHMNFNEEENWQNIDWDSISKFVLSKHNKQFNRALDKLNQIKLDRFGKKIQEGNSSKFFEALLKVKKRKIVQHNKCNRK